MLLVPFSERSVEQALGAGPALVRVAREERMPVLAASLLTGPAVLLGRHQRAARVLDVDRCRGDDLPVFRRATSGTAAFLARRAILFSLALPHVAALFPDASHRTLLNRNVRPFLRGLTAVGALSHHFGREWVSTRRRPSMSLGFDAAEDGAVLLEVVGGFDEPFALPAELASDDERALDRHASHAPVALAEVLPPGTAEGTVAGAIADAVAARSDLPVSLLSEVPSLDGSGSFRVDLDSADPVPTGATLLEPARIPIGWLERAALADGRLWLGGDVLAPRSLLDRIAAAAAGGADAGEIANGPLDGVSLAELLEKSRGQKGLPAARGSG